MATEAQHMAAANRTQETIAHLLEKKERTSPWLAIAAFYKALHVVEAAFYNDKNIGHTSNHGDREQTLKRARKYDHINKHYSKLCRASIVARYLQEEPSFDDYVSPDDVVEKLLNHHLRQVEQSAAKFLKSPDELRAI